MHDKQLVTVSKKTGNKLKNKLANYQEPQRVKAAGIYPYFRVIESEQNTEVQIGGKKVLMFGSNSYLGLTNHPKLKEAARQAVAKYGSGMAGSRFLNGTIDLHIELEKRLAEFVGKPDAIVFSTGYQANLGVIACMMGRSDFILNDEYNHASLIDGSRLSFAKVRKFRHNDMESLDKMLDNINRSGNEDQIKLVVVDGIFSMEGDLAKMDEIVPIAKKHGANILVDEAHALGVLGKNGSGTAALFNVTDEVDLLIGTFSKSLASIGGFVAADSEIINFLKHHARTFIFSASIAPSNAASVLAALDLIESEPERIDQLWKNTNFAMRELRNIGFEIGHTQTPIIPIYVRDDLKTFKYTQMLIEEGVFVNPVISPAVASTSSLIRFSLMANHTQEQIELALSKLEKCARKIGLLA